MQIQTQHPKLPIVFVLDNIAKAVAFKFVDKGTFVDYNYNAVWDKKGLSIDGVLFESAVLHKMEEGKLKEYLKVLVDEALVNSNMPFGFH